MSDKSNILWTDATWNPVTGCTKVSDGCKHCYAERDWARLAANPKTRYYDRKFTDVQEHGDILDQPLRWQRPRRIFVNSMSDLFHPDVSDRFIADVFGVMAAARHHTFQVLTKRPARMLQILGAGCMGRFQDDVEECMALYTDAPLVWPIPNVWIGVTAENQKAADERIPLLLDTPAAVRWISVEPLIGPLSFRWAKWHDYSTRAPGYVHGHLDGMRGIDWVVVAGESGPKARPMHPAWVRALRDQCAEAGVPFLFKQWGEFVTEYQSGQDINFCYDHSTTGGWIEMDGTYSIGDGAAPSEPMTAEHVFRLGKKAAGRLLDGKLHDGYPE